MLQSRDFEINRLKSQVIIFQFMLLQTQILLMLREQAYIQCQALGKCNRFEFSNTKTIFCIFIWYLTICHMRHKMFFQLAQLSKNQQMIVNQKNQFQQQLTTAREELRKAHEETRKNLLEKTRLQQQVNFHFFFCYLT